MSESLVDATLTFNKC